MATIRLGTEADAPDLGRMAAGLVRLHHAYDAQRFIMVEGNIEEGYGRWLARETKNERAVVLVAELEGKIVGYAYATLQDRDWMMLLDACGVLQDIWVDEQARRAGVAKMLVLDVCRRFRDLGAPRVVLSTAAKNEGAQKFFEEMGFRRTMIEMTRELEK
ncbi:MAG TPA: GNAT family N-acetyltransferase [Polyangiaceae bacterium]|jgi:ribosomal protein S18 acetylase RimI-like enzyme